MKKINRARCSISISAADRPGEPRHLVQNGTDCKFPASHTISPKRRAWYEDEVLAWQRALTVNSKISRRIGQSQ